MRIQGARANWSWTTAARAVLRADDHLNECNDKGQLLQEIQDCWAMDPICTSVVIHFWQRCLCKLATIMGNPRHGTKSKPVDLILHWLPLKADRSLPGILLDTMRRCGWTKRTFIAAGQPQCQVVKASEAKPNPPANLTPSVHVLSSPCAPVMARYCRAHNTTQKRGKVEPRYQDCSSCRTMIQTNYADFALCPPCSDKQDRCMICGLSCNTSTLEAQSPAPANHGHLARTEDPAVRSTAPTFCGSIDVAPPAPLAVPAPVPARYCSAHSWTEKRPKTEPRLRECTGCHIHIQTNYLDFALCPPCSEKRDQCMICGASASEARSYMPAPLPVKAEDHCPRLSGAASLLGSVGDAVPPLPAASSLPAHAPPRYCALHSTTDKRPKAEPRLRECTACHVHIQTNYLDFALCPPCSEMRDQCMICGASAPEARSYIPTPLPVKAEDQTSRHSGQRQIPPRYCCMHDTTQKRPKAEPRFRECTACRMMVQTNYADFMLCPPCSDKEKRCMLCGSCATNSGSCMLPPNIMGPAPLPSLLSRNM